MLGDSVCASPAGAKAADGRTGPRRPGPTGRSRPSMAGGPRPRSPCRSRPCAPASQRRMHQAVVDALAGRLLARIGRARYALSFAMAAQHPRVQQAVAARQAPKARRTRVDQQVVFGRVGGDVEVAHEDGLTRHRRLAALQLTTVGIGMIAGPGPAFAVGACEDVHDRADLGQPGLAAPDD